MFLRSVFLLALVVISGCQTAEPLQTGHDILYIPRKTISAQQLAERLGLRVKQDTGSAVTLRNAGNWVMLFPDPVGHAYVNGTPVGPQGGFVRIGGILFVPETLEQEIRSVLTPLPEPQAPALVPKLPPAPAKPRLARAYRIVVDPGHGGKDPGAISRGGLMEKNVNLPVAKELARLLKQDGFDVVMTRQTDVFVELNERAAIANRFAADLFVSIHADSCPDPEVRGFTIYTCQGASTASRAIAKAVADTLHETSGESQGLREANYRVLVRTECPAILVELGYLSNGLDAAMLARDADRMRLARAIADGVAAHFR
jgi:N-acetylmuramoyl-L-alanine amidase